MFKKNTVAAVSAGMIIGALGVQVRGAGAAARAGAEDEEYRVVAMENDPAEKVPAGAKAAANGTESWDEIIKANDFDKLTKNDKQLKKAELAEDFDADSLDPVRQLDWYGAAEECASGRLPNHKELLKIWDAECKESTSAVCSAVYWTSEKQGDKALGVNFLNGHVLPKDLDSFAYARCMAGKKGRKPADAPSSAKAGKKKGADTSAKVVDFIRNYQPKQDGPRLEDKMAVMITSAGGSASTADWEVNKKGPGLFAVRALVPAGDGEIEFAFRVNLVKKTVTPADARAKAMFKAITDPDINDGDMR